jgi:hypothetical protein
VSYHLPSTDVRLFSPQVYHQIYGGHSIVNGDEVVMRIRDEHGPITIAIPIDKEVSNLPIVRNSFVPEKVKKKIAHKFRSALVATGLYAALDYFADTISRSSSTLSRMQGLFTSFPCVGGVVHANVGHKVTFLTPPLG